MTHNPPPDLSYGNKTKRWTSVGILAITAASISVTSVAILLLAYLPRRHVAIPNWVVTPAILIGFISGAAGLFLGLIGCLAGTADFESRTDSRLGMIALPMAVASLSIAIVFSVIR